MKALNFVLISFFLFAGVFANQTLAQSPFVPIKLSNGISFVLPKNWMVIDTNTRTTLEASVAARVPIEVDSSLPFAANLYDSNDRVIGIVNLRIYPNMDVYQNEVIGWNSSMMDEINQVLRNSLSEGVMLGGGEVTHWYGTEKARVNQKVYLLSKYRRRSAINPNSYFRVSLLRLLEGEKSFTLTMSYEEKNEYFLKPIIEYVKDSVKTP